MGPRGWTKTVPNLPCSVGGRTGDCDRVVQKALVYGPPDGRWRMEGGMLEMACGIVEQCVCVGVHL